MVRCSSTNLSCSLKWGNLDTGMTGANCVCLIMYTLGLYQFPGFCCPPSPLVTGPVASTDREVGVAPWYRF